ncbi:MAG: NUDIX hydrolase [Paracoccaceae bacterium]
MIRRFGEPAVAGKKYILRPGAYAILVRGNAMLVTHQAEPAPEFQLPGGGIDAGESSIQALHREVFEETGWSIKAPRKVGAFRRFVYMPEYDMWAEKVAHVFLATPVRSHGEPTEVGHRAVWMSAEMAVELLANDGDRDFVRRILL